MAATDHPNILFIMSDDIGWFNVSCYNHGVMGYRTPNIDRIAAEGAMFTDFYGQQSCTAGRAAFITGQQPIRTGLTKVGFPGAMQGLSAEDPTIAQFLKNFGYATGQFGKNHVGDRNEHLPTVHGFDEFFGNLYHLNAEESPEATDYPKDPKFRKRFGPRGVLRCKATDVDDETVDEQFGKVGKQIIENTGPLDTKRMETVDEEAGRLRETCEGGRPAHRGNRRSCRSHHRNPVVSRMEEFWGNGQPVSLYSRSSQAHTENRSRNGLPPGRCSRAFNVTLCVSGDQAFPRWADRGSKTMDHERLVMR